jgi:RND family efflux transporter MFP subunit
MPDHNHPDLHLELIDRPARPRRRLRGALGWVVALGFGAAVGWFAMPHLRPRPAPLAPVATEAPPALTVVVAPVRRQALARPVIGDGSVVAWQELLLGTETGGLRVVEVNFEEGDAVRAGQVLVRLDPALPTAQATQAQAATAEAEAALRIAQADLRRSVDLARSEAVARQILDQREAAAKQAEARLLASRAREEEAKVRLAQATIAAPADGIVSRRTVLLGAVVQPGQELLRLIRDGRVELAMRIPELELAAVRPGQAARVVHGEREVAGRVRVLAPVVSGDTRLGLAYVALPAGSGLRPGMFARGEIAPEGMATQLTVPQEAVVFREGRAVAFVLADDGAQVQARTVRTGQRRDGVVEVVEGLREGERVVASGAGFLADGDRVRVAPAR